MPRHDARWMHHKSSTVALFTSLATMVFSCNGLQGYYKGNYKAQVLYFLYFLELVKP